MIKKFFKNILLCKENVAPVTKENSWEDTITIHTCMAKPNTMLKCPACTYNSLKIGNISDHWAKIIMSGDVTEPITITKSNKIKIFVILERLKKLIKYGRES